MTKRYIVWVEIEQITIEEDEEGEWEEQDDHEDTGMPDRLTQFDQRENETEEAAFDRAGEYVRALLIATQSEYLDTSDYRRRPEPMADTLAHLVTDVAALIERDALSDDADICDGCGHPAHDALECTGTVDSGGAELPCECEGENAA